MLFDGTVTLTGPEPVPIELESPLIVGATLNVTVNGETFSGDVEEITEGVIGMAITVGEGTLTVATMNGNSFFQMGLAPSVIGENSVKIVQSE